MWAKFGRIATTETILRGHVSREIECRERKLNQ
jgi:hypothetical protein